jgi:hypothetical protein
LSDSECRKRYDNELETLEYQKYDSRQVLKLKVYNNGVNFLGKVYHKYALFSNYVVNFGHLLAGWSKLWEVEILGKTYTPGFHLLQLGTQEGFNYLVLPQYIVFIILFRYSKYIYFLVCKGLGLTSYGRTALVVYVSSFLFIHINHILHSINKNEDYEV